jgi:hypothetical protein
VFECKQCDKKFKKIISLSRHYLRTHNIKQKEFYIDYVLNGEKPTCKCGCGKEPKFYTATVGFSEFMPGHVARVRNNWGHNSSAQEKSQNKRRQMLKDGEYKVWNSGLTMDDPRIRKSIQQLNSKEANKKISIALTGKKKSPEHIIKITKHMREYWGKEENRKRQSKEQAERIKNGLLTKATRVHGYFSNHTKSTRDKVYYRSLFELNALTYIEKDSNIIEYTLEPYRIEYNLEENKIRNYVIDLKILCSDGTKKIIEIKPNCYLKYDVNVKKFKAAQEFADKHGYLFEVWTEKTHPFLQNPV